MKRAAQIVAAALVGTTSGEQTGTSPDEGALMNTVETVVQIAQIHRTTRPAIAAESDVTGHAQAQQVAYARRTLSTGYYRTNTGVVRVGRARAGHAYAATRTPEGTLKGIWPEQPPRRRPRCANDPDRGCRLGANV